MENEQIQYEFKLLLSLLAIIGKWKLSIEQKEDQSDFAKRKCVYYAEEVTSSVKVNF